MMQADKKEIDRLLDRLMPSLVEDVFQLVRIPSVSGMVDGDFPYGKGCADVLDTTGQIARKQGFSFTNYDYHCGSISLSGTTDREIALFTHLDIVPEGNGWSVDPFSPYIRDEHIFGRGTTDNKGPAVAAIYLLSALRDSGIKLRHSVKLYFGCDEEAGMRDLSYYLRQNPPPALGLVPDASYSVCCGEKGILELGLEFTIADSNIVDFHGGTAANMVPDYGEITLSGVSAEQCTQQLPAESGCTVVARDDCVTISATGASAHAAFPEKGISATAKLAVALTASGLVTGKGASAVAFLAEAFSDCHGRGLGIAAEDISGKLTHVGSVLTCQGGKLTQTVNIRYPVTMDQSLLSECLPQRCRDAGAEVAWLRNNPPVYTAPDNPVVALLNRIACEELEQQFEPYTMGGGTYARKLPFALAFGPLRKDLPRPGGGGHQPDECVSIQGLRNFIKIYLRAICELDKLL